MDKDKTYFYDVGTSIKSGKPFFENGCWWFDAKFAHVKCKSVNYWL